MSQDRSGYNHKTDVYSVGITILELLAGCAPFEGFPNTKVSGLLFAFVLSVDILVRIRHLIRNVK